MLESAKRALTCLLALTAVVALCAVAITIDSCSRDTQAQQESEQQAAAAKTVEGLPAGTVLASEPDRIENGYAVYVDRVVKLFETDAETVERCAASQAALFNGVPGNVRKLAMLYPTRMAFEESLADAGSNERQVIADAYALLPADVTAVDAYGAVEAHRDEYVYFRTEDEWTALGAYYASRALFDALDRQGTGIGDYREDTRTMFFGTLLSAADATAPEDVVSLFLVPDSANHELVSRRRGEETVTYEAPMLATSRGALDTILGKRVSHSVVQGDAPGAGSIMVVGDGGAKALVPWLTCAYDRVIYISSDWHKVSPAEFLTYFEHYDVVDFVIAQGVDNLSTGLGNGRLRRLVEGA